MIILLDWGRMIRVCFYRHFLLLSVVFIMFHYRKVFTRSYMELRLVMGAVVSACVLIAVLFCGDFIWHIFYYF